MLSLAHPLVDTGVGTRPVEEKRLLALVPTFHGNQVSLVCHRTC